VGLIDRAVVFRATRAGLLIAALALAGCGRNGPPEPPPSAAVTNGTDASATGVPSAPKPKRTFILDPLVR
jgi:predicted small lipoprotein YifL